MERFKKILFFADPQGTNDTALNRAVDLAERQGARLTVVDVVEAVPAEVGRLLRSWSSEQLARLLHEERAAELRRHGVPERRAQIVALRERGLSYGDIVEATGAEGPNHRGDVSKHLQAFNRQVGNANWLAENADTFELGN